MVRVDDKTRITGKRVQVVLKNPDLSDTDLSEKTGLPVKLVREIREVDKRGLRKDDLHGR